MTHYLPRRLRFIWRYMRGDAPWDSGIVPPEVVAWIEAAESAGQPPGRALDMGCGTGTTSIFLASRGWHVVGVDFAPNAIRQAQAKARAARREWARREAPQRTPAGHTTFFSADVSRPDFLSDADPFDLVIDVGCVHGLTADQRAAYAQHLARLTRPGASYLLYAFGPRLSHNGRREIGFDPDGVRSLFGPAFALLDYALGEDVTAPVASGWYTLRRTGDDS